MLSTEDGGSITDISIFFFFFNERVILTGIFLLLSTEDSNCNRDISVAFYTDDSNPNRDICFLLMIVILTGIAFSRR